MKLLHRINWPSIRVTFPLSLLVMSSLVIIGFWRFETMHEMDNIEQHTMERQVHELHRIVSHVQRLLARGNIEGINSELVGFSSEARVRYIVLLDPAGRIVASSRQGWIGKKRDELPDRWSNDLLQSRHAGDDVAVLSEDRNTIRAQLPIQFPSRSKSLRSQASGTLIANFDLRLDKRAAMRRIEVWSGLFGLMVMSMAFLFWLGSRFAITRRMNRLIAAANRASRGDFSVRANLKGNDELAQIGAAFDAMIEHLGSETIRLQQLSRAVENMNESVLITDSNGTIQYVNSAFTRITGYEPQEAIGNNPRMLKSGKHPPEFYEAFWGRISKGKVWKGRMTDRKKDGSLYLAKVSVAPLVDSEGHITHYVGVQEDVSEQQKMELQLLQAQKMESLGTLVGGIAHDFNNMLAGMVGNLYMARKRIKDQPEVTQKLERVEKLSFRAADMIKQLLAFARKDMIQFRAIELGPFVKEAFKLSRVAIPENIQCISEIGSEVMHVECDATQVQQMLMNLLTNARDALVDVEQPTIRLSLTRFEPDKAFIREHPEADAPAYAALSVQDNGSGIPEEDQERIFEPFFTTKGVGQGSGLGLSMVFGAMKSHHGLITTSSEPGRTEFTLYFPISARSGDGELPVDTGDWAGHGGRLLLADDEPIVRETIGEMLRIDGFEVDVVSDGQEALDRFREAPGRYAAVILDVVMPRMGGMDTAQRMRELRPDIPIIFATGYDRDHVLRGLDDLTGIVALSKPLHSTALRQTLGELLEQAGKQAD